MSEFLEIASGLRFPEGPVAMADGSVLVVEMFGECVTRVRPDGSKELVAEVPGGPNGAAIGPDGALYLCNNGRAFSAKQIGDLVVPGPFDPDRYLGGRIQRLDLGTGALTDLYTECDGHPLRAPNDLVFDSHGGFYFTDHGIRDHDRRTSDLTGIYYATADGSSIRELVFPTEAPNGIGLSPDGSVLSWVETHSGRVYRRGIESPGVLAPSGSGRPDFLARPEGLQLFDSLAVDAEGNLCVATLISGGITVIAPDGATEFVPTEDRLTTNICFGGPDLRTAFITYSGSGRLVSTTWRCPGLALAHGG